MSDVSKNIKKLRLSAKMTQDDLAAKLHVTRQSVSSWENGRTQPDLETLRSIADIFGTDEMEVIYGKRTAAAQYPTDKALRIRLTVLFGAAAILLILIRLIWLPQEYIEYCYYRYLMQAVYISILVVRPLLAAAVCLSALSLLSVWKDIRIKGQVIRKVFLIIAIVCTLSFYALIPLLCFHSETQLLPPSIWNLAITLLTHPESIFALIGITAFLGCNR